MFVSIKTAFYWVRAHPFYSLIASGLLLLTAIAEWAGFIDFYVKLWPDILDLASKSWFKWLAALMALLVLWVGAQKAERMAKAQGEETRTKVTEVADVIGGSIDASLERFTDSYSLLGGYFLTSETLLRLYELKSGFERRANVVVSKTANMRGGDPSIVTPRPINPEEQRRELAHAIASYLGGFEDGLLVCMSEAEIQQLQRVDESRFIAATPDGLDCVQDPVAKLQYQRWWVLREDLNRRIDLEIERRRDRLKVMAQKLGPALERLGSR